MAQIDRQQAVLNILQDLRSLDGLKKLFWEELNYERENKPLSPRQWPDNAKRALAEDPILFASGGEGNAFHVVYGRLTSPELSRGLERPVVNQLLRDHSYALFIFSNKSQSAWHFLNVKFDEQAERRRLFRRITVRPGAGLRTATERVQLLDLAGINPELLGIAPLTIQQRCDVAFDVEAVTKDFFREIANWYFWALKNVRFPKDAPKEADGHDHISVIRLITRLIFCWFVKEKGLIPDALFDEHKLTQTLTGFEPAKASDKASVFYKAILQNLFFATLNTEMDKRGWTKEEQNFMAHSLYRHRECFSEPKSALDLFKEIPFLNGGLFECLDKDLGENTKPRYLRIDGFSRREDSQPVVPDFLFFGPEKEGEEVGLDWREIYGCRPQNTKVRGLIDTLQRYHFTIEENTPIEQEVALDPELSGKVFENLLAAYNPETGATARKQTGSFYTPREIVNYMVEEALIACLKEKLTAKTAKNTKTEENQAEASSSARSAFSAIEQKLRHLFAYNDEPHQFTAPEVDALIAAIDGLKSLDPAVGSGAFPMGILHKLVFILGKLDPRNEKWKERQIARVRDTLATAEKIEDATARERAVHELEQQIAGIKEAFEHNELDYGRKLYLIENCIYGADIQPIAVQIAKMRFFISLIVDQKIDETQPNRGVRPLPNLETKFVAANTLIGVNRPGQQLLRNRDIDAKEAELRRVRERYFVARTPRQKSKCRDDDARLRAEIAELLKGDGWDTATARKLAGWDPYDQSASADFFDVEWMFGIDAGVDVVIGNPPYISNDTIPDDQKARYQERYLTGKRFDLYQCFIECGIKLLGTGGNEALILPNTFLTGRSYEKLRTFLLDKTAIYQIVDLPQDVFDNATVDNILFFISVPASADNKIAVNLLRERSLLSRVTLKDWDDSYTIEQSVVSEGEQRAIIVALTPIIRKIFAKLKTEETLGCRFDVCDGLIPYKTAVEADVARYTGFIEKPGWGRLLRGKGIARFVVAWQGEFVKYGEHLWCKRDERFFTSHKILLHSIRNKALPRRLVAALDRDSYYNTDNLINVIQKSTTPPLEFLLGLLNSKLINFWYRLNYPNVNINPNELRSVPLPAVNAAQVGQVVEIVAKVLAHKKHDPKADTKEFESQVDSLVYEIYSIDKAEAKLVEEAIP